MKKSRLSYARSYSDRHDRTRWRYRRGRFSAELGTDFGSDEFKRRYAEAEARFLDKGKQGAGADRTRPRSVGDLVSRFYKSPTWRALSAGSVRTYRGPIEAFRASYGDLLVKDIRKNHVMNILAKKADTPSAANNLRKRLIQIFDYGIDLDFMTKNPARETKPYEIEGEGFHPWDEGEIARFFEVHKPGTVAHCAVTLMLYTGAARVDACKLGPWSVKAGRIEYRRQKTIRTNGVLVSIPLHPDLADVLANLPDDRPFLATAYGKARSPEGLGNKMRDWCDQAGLANCAAHGLRKAIARRLAEAGATAHEIMAVTGHKTLAEVQRYTESAMREGFADAGFAKLMTRPNGEQNVVNLPNRFTGISGKPLKEKGK